MLPLARPARFRVKPLLFHHRLLSLTAAGASPPSVSIEESHLLRVCTVLYQQQTATDAKLHEKLCKTRFDLTHEFFLQVCNKFPYSWRPIYRFHQFAISRPGFAHSSTSFNKMLDVVGKSRNIELFSELCHEIGRLHLANTKTYVVALRTLAVARELKKCVEFFHLMNAFGYGYRTEDLNKVVEVLCRNKLVAEAKHLVVKLTDCIRPDGDTYRWLMYGFCDVGDLIEASKMWNLMMDLGCEIGNNSVEIILERLFKDGEFDKALRIFRSIGNNIPASAYQLVIKWLCKKGKLGDAHHMFDEMRMRGMKPDNETLGFLLYLLMSKGRVNEAYNIFGSIKDPDVALHYFSNEEGVVMFEAMAGKLREVGLFDLADIFERYGLKMATRDRRRNTSRR